MFVNPQPTEDALRRYHAGNGLLSQDGWSSYFAHSAEQIRELWEERLADLKRYLEGPRRRRVLIEAGLPEN